MDENCRHEFVRIYQRKLKGLDRRLVATKAYLPVGFKVSDFSHLSEGSYCFCTKCRARLYPKRTNADRLAARLAAAKSAEEAAEAAGAAREENLEDANMVADESNTSVSVSVEELQIESTDLQDLKEDIVPDIDSDFGQDEEV